jgi:hypothetical protein
MIMGQSWVQSVSSVTDNTGNLKQIYPDWAPTGANPASATNGQWIRKPCEGELNSLQVKTDGVNGGTIEIWDVNGIDAGADVSSGTAITAAQLAALVTRGLAKLMYSQNFIASPETPFNVAPCSFQRGIAARFISAAGSCTLNLKVAGGFRLTQKLG